MSLSANQISVIKEQATAGFPSRLPGVCDVYPGMMRDMLQMGSDKYSQRLGLLLLTETEIQKILRDKQIPSHEFGDTRPLPYLLKNAAMSERFSLDLNAAFSTFIKKEEILLLPKINAVLVGPMTEKRLITQENFNDFQTILRLQNRREVPEPPPENETPIARKMRLAREMRDAVKRKQQQKDSGSQELADLLEIAKVFGIDYLNESIYSFYGLIQRYQRKEKWDQDLQMLCAGADSSKIKAKYWGVGPDK